MYKLNSRPRKYLEYATIYEAFMKLSAIDAVLVIKGICL
jgi:IS30 family transposase